MRSLSKLSLRLYRDVYCRFHWGRQDDSARLSRIRRPNPVRQGRKVKRSEGHFSAREKFCIPMRTALADMWCCVRNRLPRSVTISRRTILLFLSLSRSLLPFRYLFALCNVGRRVSHSRCCSFGAGKPRRRRDWSPSACVCNRARRLCNVSIFFLPPCISDSLNERSEITLQVYYTIENITSGYLTVWLGISTYQYIFPHSLSNFLIRTKPYYFIQEWIYIDSTVNLFFVYNIIFIKIFRNTEELGKNYSFIEINNFKH